MSNLTVVGHFSMLLGAAWILWLFWCAWQVRWYRRSMEAAAPMVVGSQPKPDRAAATVTATPEAPEMVATATSSAPTADAAPVLTAAVTEPTPAAPTAGLTPDDESAKARRRRRRRRRRAALAADTRISAPTDLKRNE
ncbi:MAG TPA: hypothetical protein VGY57_10370 [Vicinamibacterales bacterium]|jgi:hypothetical protein|nr:hypothetical protein [Vicinamibacterales bacterium]